jgi:sugar lactone lactonase YvrE
MCVFLKWRRLTLLKIATSATLVLSLGFFLACGSTSAGMSPSSVTSAPPPPSNAQNVLIADASNNRILIFNSPTQNGENAATVLGQADFTSAVPATTATGLYSPVGAIADADGNIWVSDWGGSRILEYKQPISDGMPASLVIGQTSFTENGQSASANGLSEPHGIIFDKSGNLWVADSSNNRVLEFVPPFSSGLSASLTLGQLAFGTNICTQSSSNLCYPTDLAFDASGDLWVVDCNNNRILEYTPPFTTGKSAILVIGQIGFNLNSSGSGSNGLNYPWGIAIDSADDVWVSDGLNWRVLKFSPPFSSGQAADLVLGFPDFVTTVNSNPQSSLSNPRGLAFDDYGSLYIANDLIPRVMVFSPPFTSGMEATTVIGQPNFTSVGASTTPSGLADPVGVHLVQ